MSPAEKSHVCPCEEIGLQWSSQVRERGAVGREGSLRISPGAPCPRIDLKRAACRNVDPVTWRAMWPPSLYRNYYRPIFWVPWLILLIIKKIVLIFFFDWNFKERIELLFFSKFNEFYTIFLHEIVLNYVAIYLQ